MFSSSVINTAAPGSSNQAPHQLSQHQHLPISSYSDIFSHHKSSICGNFHHYTNLEPAVVAQDGHDHVLNESTVTFITPFGKTTSTDMPRSGSRATKKSDKRSKIRTSQGLRDRRVRLSIEISRKFFDLQDLLGFDKPSRTVEWLLSKSNKAILELSGASSSSISSEAAGTEDGLKSLSSSRSTAICSTNQIQQVSSKYSLKTMKQKAALLARESREKARARARARTAAKLSTSKLDLQNIILVNNPGAGVNRDDLQMPHFKKIYNNFSSPSLWKASDVERKEEKIEGEEQLKRKQQLQLDSYYHNPNLSLDWDISSIIPQQISSATTQRLNLYRDVYTRSSWDHQLPNIYNTL